MHDLHKLYCSAVAVTTPLDAIEWLLASGNSLTIAFADSAKPYSSEDGLFELLNEEYPYVKKVLLANDELSLKAYRNVPYDKVLPQPWTQQQLSQVLAK